MNKIIIVYIITGILIIGLVMITFFQGTLQAWKDATKSSDDICKPGPGYTESSWREHMSHHPNIYKKCLEG